MAVNLPPLPELHPVAGIRLGTARAGIRKPDRRDLVVVECAPGTRAAAVFTRNRFCAAPVTVAREHLAQSAPRALVINTGFANAGTGADGLADARATCTAAAGLFGCVPQAILPFSTGVIGERLPVERLAAGLPAAIAALGETGWSEAAHGIMTTDTLPKGASRRVPLGGKTVTITGIAKGAGMICPNMATMLAFVATDAAIDGRLLQQSLAAAADASFNRISIDGDTSTNDACVLLATGQSGVVIDAAHPDVHAVFNQTLRDVLAELAQAIVRDGEGATKFITIDVEQGASEAECLEVAQTIAHSPLVKTAFFASDPNWGRILAAIGRARIPRLDVECVSVYLNDVCIVRHGGRAPGYTEAQGLEVMKQAEIRVRVVLGAGSASARLWTCDLSHDYVRINAEYRT
jgi:glutamate N-acetyltransferase / amino-acid N-acetyltransferase